MGFGVYRIVFGFRVDHALKRDSKSFQVSVLGMDDAPDSSTLNRSSAAPKKTARPGSFGFRVYRVCRVDGGFLFYRVQIVQVRFV